MEKIWQQSYSSGVPTEINPDEYTSLNELFEQSCEKYAALPAFSNLGVKLTYAELEEQSRYFAAYLLEELKLQKGDRVAIMLPNLLQYPVAMFGILRAGLVVVNINPLYTSPEVEHLLTSSAAKVIIVLANFAKTVEKIIQNVPLQRVIVTEVGDMYPGLKKTLVNFAVRYIKRMVPSYEIVQSENWLNTLSIGSQYDYTMPAITGEDQAFLQYTGGTTGHPKAAILTHRNMVTNVLQCEAWVKGATTPGEDIVLGALPLYHIFSLTVCCMTFMALGAECLLITNPRDIKRFLNTLSKVPVSIFIGLNTLFNAMMNHPNFSNIDFSRLKLTIAGGMPMQSSVAKRWNDCAGTPVLQGYGLTEASPVVCINPIDAKQFSSSIGLPVPSTDVQVRDEAGKVLGIDAVGELYIKGPQVMQGYWQEPEETAKVLDQDGWLATGDIVCMDSAGFITIVDRKKDMILVSGFNVSPNEIEEVLSQHPGIQEVAVVGVPSEQTGEAIKAFIVRSDHSLTEQSILNYCHQSLTSYKLPKLIEFREALPKSHIGKILRKDLKHS